jgi:hypothetical protein
MIEDSNTNYFYVVRAARGAVYADPVGGNGSSTSR